MLLAATGLSQNPEAGQPASDPLAPFERLAGGEWHLEGSYQVFEWGVGRQSVKARSYFVVEGKPRLVSEGLWFWHPGEAKIKGIFTAIDMPVNFFDYTTRFEGNKMVNTLRAYAPGGKETVFEETWEFTDESHFEWKLMSETPDGMQQQMSGTYTRKKESRFPSFAFGENRLRSTACNWRTPPLVPLASLDLPNRGRRVAFGC